MPTTPASPQFHTTRWSVVLRAADQPTSEANTALSWLCERYWYPLYAFARRKGQSAENALDLTQGFFANLLEKNAIGGADPKRGRFRTFLLTAFSNFLANEWDKQKAAKRGGGKAPVSFDAHDAETRYNREPSHELTAEKLYERRWALDLLERAVKKLEADWNAERKSIPFEKLKNCLTGNASAETYAEIGASVELSESAVKVAVHRLRKRYKEVLREEIASTVANPDNPAEIEAELQTLINSL
jgi:RNA polymerase sigma-70 factor (ECF subfamily)